MTLTRALVGFVLCGVGVMLFLAVANEQPAPKGGERTLYNVQVLKLGTDGFHYQLREGNSGFGFWAKFCDDYEPQFDAGMTLTILKVQDFGACWSVRETHPAYLIKRDDRGNIMREDFHANQATAQAN